MYKIYTDEGYLLKSTDFGGLIQALKFMVWTCKDIHNVLNGIKKSNTVVVVDKFGNYWRIDYIKGA